LAWLCPLPLYNRFWTHVRPRDDVIGQVIGRTKFSLSYASPHPQTCLCMGGGVSVGPAVCYGPGAISMKENWVPYKGLLSSYTHNFIRLLNAIPRWQLRIALYIRLCTWSIVTRCRGMGYKIPPWGFRGLQMSCRLVKNCRP